MTIVLMILLIPLLALAWYGIDYLVREIMKDRYHKNISVISFVLMVPVLFVIFIYTLLWLAFMSGAEFKD